MGMQHGCEEHCVLQDSTPVFPDILVAPKSKKTKDAVARQCDDCGEGSGFLEAALGLKDAARKLGSRGFGGGAKGAKRAKISHGDGDDSDTADDGSNVSTASDDDAGSAGSEDKPIAGSSSGPEGGSAAGSSSAPVGGSIAGSSSGLAGGSAAGSSSGPASVAGQQRLWLFDDSTGEVRWSDRPSGDAIGRLLEWGHIGQTNVAIQCLNPAHVVKDARGRDVKCSRSLSTWSYADVPKKLAAWVGDGYNKVARPDLQPCQCYTYTISSATMAQT